MASSNSPRSCASKLIDSTKSFLPRSVTETRGFHSTGVKRMTGGYGHDEPFYLHAKNMYNLDRMKYQKLTMTLGVLTAFSIGVGVPIFAVIFQQKKTASA
ncbi:Rho GTPase-activating protein [Actinidia chinensis var. chinensis]|uniref:Rho GTPase-activating protein n=1 Tax=Actinidia chinensis var. chinensis TaxID=1590841 RepID=A0A2R6QYK2_ACTCC|nr:Rho GTPase-activating protein [Actinidia chinensis var. chinensis]